MTTAILALAVVACFIWAIVASTAASEWRLFCIEAEDQRDRAEAFAEECLADLARERSL